MDIIIGATSFDADKQARAVLKAKWKKQEAQGSLPLVGIAESRAHYPHTCDDCGLTHWNTDEWGSDAHINCRGGKKKPTGF